MGSMREAGAHQQAAALADRLPAAGMFGLFAPRDSTAVTCNVSQMSGTQLRDTVGQPGPPR